MSVSFLDSYHTRLLKALPGKDPRSDGVVKTLTYSLNDILRLNPVAPATQIQRLFNTKITELLDNFRNPKRQVRTPYLDDEGAKTGQGVFESILASREMAVHNKIATPVFIAEDLSKQFEDQLNGLMKGRKKSIATAKTALNECLESKISLSELEKAFNTKIDLLLANQDTASASNTAPTFLDEDAAKTAKKGFQNVKKEFISNNKEAIVYSIRDETRELLSSKLESQPIDKTNLFKDHVVLYKSQDLPKPVENQENLFRRFDVVSVVATMDYNADWQPLSSSQKPFFIHHGAALNIGENAKAEDFKEYSDRGSLDEERYIRDMGRIMKNMLDAQKASGAKRAVWFPFGMGAFLKKLPDNDPAYNKPQKMVALRNKIATEFMNQVAQTNIEIHICLPKGELNSATNDNFHAFQAALSKAPASVQKRVLLRADGDATDIAQTLANQHGPKSVSLANGANRNLIGNHWFGNRAMHAIDENIHRRSLSAAYLAYHLNNGKDSRPRTPDELANRIRNFGGKVQQLQPTGTAKAFEIAERIGQVFWAHKDKIGVGLVGMALGGWSVGLAVATAYTIGQRFSGYF